MKLDAFTQAYIEAALWSTLDGSTPEGGEPLDKNYELGDLTEETLDRIKRDCVAFQSTNARWISSEHYLRSGIRPSVAAGYDFWLTRNGHGAGFWDGDWSDEADAVLTAASKAAGEVHLYVGDDKKIHIT